MPKLKSYGVFISHAWDYDADYYRLERMLNKPKRFKWRNCSVPQHNPLDANNDAQLEKALRDQIRPANVVVIISGMYVNHRKWIQKEIDIALEMNKPIIGIAPRGAQRTPSEVQNIAPMVGWKTSKIVDTIRNPTSPKVKTDAPPTTPAPIDAAGATSDQTSNVTDSPSFSDLRDWINHRNSDIETKLSRHGKSATRRSGMSG